MMDHVMRATIAPAVNAGAGYLRRLGVRPNQLTAAGVLLGLGSAVLAANAVWFAAGAVWLLSRLFDGLDGALARSTPRTEHDRELGGYFDIVADFVVYGSFVVGCAIGQPDARTACLVLLLTYYVNGTTFFAMSSIAERRGIDVDDASRTFRFSRGLAEGTETIVAHAAMAFFSAWLTEIAWTFAVVVAITAAQRFALTVRTLRMAHEPAPASEPVEAPAPDPAAGSA